MDGVDPDTLLEWLQTGIGEERDIQLMALEQLCMLLLMSDNIDQCFESCPPRTFLPALCKIFLDETATENVLEVTARAITYYLDVSNECTRRITQVDGAVKAICNRLTVAEMTDRTSKDLAEQCVKLLEHICQREASAVFDAGGLQCMLTMVRQHVQCVHKDTVHSAMSVITRLCSKIEPTDASLPECSANLGALLENEDLKVSECALRCFAALSDRFIRKLMDPAEMVHHGNLIEHLLKSLIPSHMSNVSSSASLSRMLNVNSAASMASTDSVNSSTALGLNRSATFTSIVISLLSNLCRGSASVTEQVVSVPLLIPALKAVLLSKDERCMMDALRFCDLILVLLCEGRCALPKNLGPLLSGRNETGGSCDRLHRHLIDAIRQKDTGALIDTIESGEVDANFTDDVGQTLLNWSSAFGTSEMVTYLCDKGADVNKGQRSSSLHYAACFGRSDIVKILLKYGANPDLRDEEGKTALNKAHERSEEGHQLVATILESPTLYTQNNDEEKQRGSKTDSKKEATPDKADPVIVKQLLEQLFPVLCEVFQRSLGVSVHRSSLTVLCKTINHMSVESLHSLVSKTDVGSSADTVFVGQKLAENLVNVLVSGLELEDDIESHENVLMIIKSLFEKDSVFWLDQLMRVGIFEKVELIANQSSYSNKTGGLVTTMIVDDIGQVSSSAKVPDNFAGPPHIGQVSSSAKLPYSFIGPPHIGQVSSSAKLPDNFLPKLPATFHREMHDKEYGESVYGGRMLDEQSSAKRGNGKKPSVVIRGENSRSNTPSSSAVPPGVEIGHPSGKSRSVLLCGVPMMHIDETPEYPISTQTAVEFSSQNPAVQKAEDCWEIIEGKSYKWKDWRLIKSPDSFFVWCDAVALEFSDGSNGWFRYVLDGQLNTMYSSGNPENGTDSTESRGEFLDKLTKARNAVPSGSSFNTVLTVPRTNNIEVGNWILSSIRHGQISISNRHGNEQSVIIAEDLPGFIFESNSHTKHYFEAEKTLGIDFATGWAARGGSRRIRFRAESQKAKLKEMAKYIWERYLKEAKSKPRDALVEVQKASIVIRDLCENKSENFSPNMYIDLENALKCLHLSVMSDRLLSTFEFSISGFIDAFLQLLKCVRYGETFGVSSVFEKVFEKRSFSALVRKAISILESSEKFVQYLYDAPGGSTFGLQLLSRLIKLKVEQLNPNTVSESQLLDRTGRSMKAEPLATVKQLRSYILRMVTKQWYDRGRESFNFVKEIIEAKNHGLRRSFKYISDFDENGLIYWLGTNGKTENEWTNPASVNVVFVTSSDGERLPYGRHEDILSRDSNALNCHSSDDRCAHFTIDLGLYFYPTTYTLRHARGYGRSALRSWILEASSQGQHWDSLFIHKNDNSLSYPGSTSTWPLICFDGKGPYRYIRISQNGKNASNQNHYLSLSGFEIYGDVVDVVVKDFKPLEEKHSLTKRSKRGSKAGREAANVKHGNRNDSVVTVADPNLSSLSDSLYAHLPGGVLNNKILAGVITPDLLSCTNALKSRFSRYRRDARFLAPNTSVKTVRVIATSLESNTCPIGSRVVRGPDWNWENQGSGTEGTVISLIDEGWIDVQWDDQTSNSYRFGADGKFDIDIKSTDTTPAIRKCMRGHRKHLLPNTTPALSTASQTSIGRNTSVSSKGGVDQTSSGAFRKSKAGSCLNSFSRFHQNINIRNAAAACTEAGFYNFLACNICGSRSHRTNNCPAMVVEFSDTQDSEKKNDGNRSIQGQSSSTIAQKSMSTTNLFDDSHTDRVSSVACTNQAASAESLQHQTPSLENLLARSRIFDDRIPEMVADEMSQSRDDHQTTGTDCLTAIDVDEENFSTNNNNGFDTSYESFDGTAIGVEQNAETSMSPKERGSSHLSIVSQSSLFDAEPDAKRASSLIIKTDDTFMPNETSDGALESSATPEISDNAVSIEETNAKNLTSLSVSVPNLDVLRHRQQSAVSSNTDCQVSSSDNDFATNVAHVIATDSMTNESWRKIPVEREATGSLIDNRDNEVRDSIRQFLIDDDKTLYTAVEGYTDEIDSVASNTNMNSNLVISLAERRALENFEMSSRSTAVGITQTCSNDGMPSNILFNDDECDVELPESNINIQSEASQAFDICHNKQEPTVFIAGAESSEVVDTSSESSLTNLTAEVTRLGSFRKEAIESCSRPSTSQNTVPKRSVQAGTRSRLNNYADVLRSVVMQQIIETGGSMDAVEIDEIKEDVYDFDVQEEGNEDDCDEEYTNGLSVEALAQAAAVLRRQSSSGSNGSSGEMKLSWKHIVMGEAGRLIGNRSLRTSTSSNENKSESGVNSRNWDDEFILKYHFNALIPAFDPRPGRNNVNQTQDVELPCASDGSQKQVRSTSEPISTDETVSSGGTKEDPKLRLYIRGPNLANVSNVTVELEEDENSIFFYVQKLMQCVEWGQKSERTRRVWEPTYTLIYGVSSDKSNFPQSDCRKNAKLNEISEAVTKTLCVISHLHDIAQNSVQFEINADIFVSEKLTRKLMQELADPLIVSSRALPTWCEELVYRYPCLFSLETRNSYFRATAFGTARSIVWLQTRRDQTLEHSRGGANASMLNYGSGRRDDHYPDYRIGRIKHERIKVPRSDDQLFDYAARVMTFHASRKSVLELEYVDEEGTGLGPTLEFYALVAAEFQRKSLAMWMCDDADSDSKNEVDLGEGIKPPGYYVRRSSGLFPAPLPFPSNESERVAELFRILGIFLAKVLQDSRLVDIPLSKSFLKLMTNSKVICETKTDLCNALNIDDLEEVAPMKGRVLKELHALGKAKNAIQADPNLDPTEVRKRVECLAVKLNGTDYKLEDLSLTFCINPSSSVFKFNELELVENGANTYVTTDNVDLYVSKCVDFYFNAGISNQISAFREGFDLVFPLRSLRLFTPDELQTLICGEQSPEWTREDIINFTEPKLGYARDSPAFLRFVDVLVGMNANERKSFLQFTTGCSSLPPGGLANLHPRLTIVRKVDSGDGSYPSVNTCVHYLKLPDYSSVEIMRERLLMATNEKGFHLN